MEPGHAATVASLTRDDFAPAPRVDRSLLRRSLLTLSVAVVVAVAVITLVPGLASLRSRFAHGDPAWLALGAVLKVLSGLSYVAAFRSVFCRGMRWRVSTQIGLSELGANAVLPTGGAGGLALGAWALRRGGMDGGHIARRSVAFFLLTSLPNVLGVAIIGFGLAAGVFAGRASLALTLVPALVATAAIVITIAGGRWAATAGRRRAARSGPASRVARALQTLADGVAEVLSLLRGRDLWLLCGLVGYLAFDVMILWATFHAFGSVPPLAVADTARLLDALDVAGALDLEAFAGNLSILHRAAGEARPYAGLRASLAREALEISSCQPGGEVEVIGRGSVRLTA